MLTPARFRAVAVALYGDQWHEALSSDLAVDRRTLLRWANGAREIPDIGAELAALCHEKARTMAALARRPPPPNMDPADGQALIEMREERARALAALADELA